MIVDQALTESIQFISQFSGEVVLVLSATSILLLLALLISVKKTRQLDKKLTRLQQDLKVSHASVINIGQQLMRLEKKVNLQSAAQPTVKNASINHTNTPAGIPLEKANYSDSIAPQVTQPAIDNAFKLATNQNVTNQNTTKLNETNQVDDSDSIYDNARYYLEKGDSVESIAKRCNLSHAEVSLLKALSKKPAESFSQ